MKSHIRFIIGVLSFALFATPAFALADTSDIASQVQSLLSQIQTLQAQLRTLVQSAHASSTPSGDDHMGTTTPSMMGHGSDKSCLMLERNLARGAQGDDVRQLQDFLHDEGFFVNASSTGVFGPVTAQALMQFQMREGIASNASGGSFGPMTRAFMVKRCADRDHGDMEDGTSTPPMMPHATSTEDHWMRPWATSTMPMMGSTTMPLPPAPCRGDDMHATSTMDNAASVALSLFVPHSIIPGRPCDDDHMPMMPQMQMQIRGDGRGPGMQGHASGTVQNF